MNIDPPVSDILSLFIINLIAQMTSALVHNICFFVMGLSYWAMHFGHYFFTFIILCCGSMCGLVEWPSAPIRRILPLALTTFVASASTAIMYDQIRESAIVCVRVADFLVTLTILGTAGYFIDKSFYSTKKSNFNTFVAIIAICSSLAWLELVKGLNYKIVIAWPFLPIATALHIMMVYQTYQKLKINFSSLVMYICGFASLITLPFALMFPIDTSEKGRVISASLEVIDYVILVIGFVSFFALKLTEYGLMCKCTPETFLVVRHGGYTLGALAHIVIRPGLLIPFFSIASKFFASFLILIYCWKRWKSSDKEKQAKQYIVGSSSNVHL